MSNTGWDGFIGLLFMSITCSLFVFPALQPLRLRILMTEPSYTTVENSCFKASVSCFGMTDFADPRRSDVVRKAMEGRHVDRQEGAIGQWW